MSETLRLLLSLITTLSIIVLVYKGIARKDVGIIGPIAPRVFLVGTILYDTILGDTDQTYFHVAIFLVIFFDLVSSLFITRSKRFFYEMYNSELISLLQNLKLKYDFIVTHAPIGIYVINRTGRFEFVNKEFCRITEYTEEELLKMSAFDLSPRNMYGRLEAQILERIEDIVPSKKYITILKTKTGKDRKVEVNAKHTINGHDTITGSVYQMEE